MARRSEESDRQVAGRESRRPALRFGIIQRPTSAVCDGDDSLIAYERTYAWQFRYDNARARYMRRPVEPDCLDHTAADSI